MHFMESHFKLIKLLVVCYLMCSWYMIYVTVGAWLIHVLVAYALNCLHLWSPWDRIAFPLWPAQRPWHRQVLWDQLPTLCAMFGVAHLPGLSAKWVISKSPKSGNPLVLRACKVWAACLVKVWSSSCHNARPAKGCTCITKIDPRTLKGS